MMSSCGPRRQAFTLLELLVLFGIIATLIAMMFPAIQKIRVLVDRSRCAHQMRQIGLAAHTYASSFGHLPHAVSMPYAEQAVRPSITDVSGIPPIELHNDSAARKNSDPNHPFGPNWAVYLLPFLDENPLFQKANIEDYFEGYRTGDAERRDRWRLALQNQKVKVYQCPTDDITAPPFDGYEYAPGPWARGNYAANAGPGWWQMSFNGGSYTESYGSTGPVMGINFGIALDRIPDGVTATVMFTEVRIGVNRKDPRGVWAMGFPGSSVVAANAIGDCAAPNDRNEQADDLEGCTGFWYDGIGTRDQMGCSRGFLNLGWPSWQAQARSRHPNGVNVCYVDGSVRFISNYVLQPVWFSMLSSDDGKLYNDP